MQLRVLLGWSSECASRTLIRLATVRERLVDEYAEVPHVALRAELAEVHGLWRRLTHLLTSHEHVSASQVHCPRVSLPQALKLALGLVSSAARYVWSGPPCRPTGSS